MRLSREGMLATYKNLPQQIKDYLASVESTDLVFSIGEKNKLTGKQILDMSSEITSVLYGISNAIDLEKNLATALKIDTNTASTLSNDVRKNILYGLEQYLPKNTSPSLEKTGPKPQKTASLPSRKLEETLEQIALKFDLRPSKTADIKKEVSLVLDGTKRREGLEKVLLDTLGLPKELTLKIAAEINSLMFSSPKASREAGVPINLPTGNADQKIPTFESEPNVREPQEIRIERKNPYTPQTNLEITKADKPLNTFLHTQDVQHTQGLSQEEILQKRPSTSKQPAPTRVFGNYKDEKIGGVSIVKEKQDEIEENIDRDSLLNDIENPIQTKASSESLRKNIYKGQDPYREPLE